VILTFLPLGEEFSYFVKRRRSFHLFFHSFLYFVIFLTHCHKLPLFILKTLLNIVSLLPIFDESLHFGYREDIVFEIIYDLQELILGT